VQSLIYNRRAVFNLKQVEFALNGDEGLSRETASVPNRIVCHVIMLGKDGLSVCEALRKEMKHIPIILRTTPSNTGNMEKDWPTTLRIT
jgi:CheY-like chemotaxis protein